jgi:hypothetical protein
VAVQAITCGTRYAALGGLLRAGALAQGADAQRQSAGEGTLGTDRYPAGLRVVVHPGVASVNRVSVVGAAKQPTAGAAGATMAEPTVAAGRV